MDFKQVGLTYYHIDGKRCLTTRRNRWQYSTGWKFTDGSRKVQ